MDDALHWGASVVGDVRWELGRRSSCELRCYLLACLQALLLDLFFNYCDICSRAIPYYPRNATCISPPKFPATLSPRQDSPRPVEYRNLLTGVPSFPEGNRKLFRQHTHYVQYIHTPQSHSLLRIQLSGNRLPSRPLFILPLGSENETSHVCT
jgi:hypothetical protein